MHVSKPGLNVYYMINADAFPLLRRKFHSIEYDTFYLLLCAVEILKFKNVTDRCSKWAESQNEVTLK